MKKLWISLPLALIAVLTVVVSASAAPSGAKPGKAGPFDGTFNGLARGSKGSQASMTLDLTHTGNQVEGTVYLGEGLFVDGGWCGSGYVPAGAWFAGGEADAKNPRHLEAESTLNVNGFDVTVELDGSVSSNGRVITAKAKVDIPWICGPDPVFNATLHRFQNQAS